MDKCTQCDNRVIASPECVKCDGQYNYKPTTERKVNYESKQITK